MMQAAPQTPHLALRYALERDGRDDVALAVPAASVHHFRLPDRETKARFVTAVLGARCERDEKLELLGEDVARLKPAGRARLRRRIGVLTSAVGLISNLNAWENISLPAAYHGTPPLGQVAESARDVLVALGDDLDPGEHARAAGFEAEYRARQPAGTLIYVDLPESRS